MKIKLKDEDEDWYKKIKSKRDIEKLLNGENVNFIRGK
jgi:hypothetical protein